MAALRLPKLSPSVTRILMATNIITATRVNTATA
jgi:hypothetical protein